MQLNTSCLPVLLFHPQVWKGDNCRSEDVEADMVQAVLEEGGGGVGEGKGGGGGEMGT